ncbi:hypothetical protein [Virgibacillus sp. SK37]|uniref:hypothetical protein n=1 Tax=Virgibacillus sp. SK37 TaxID=403957 RepID=UPI0004D18E7A|nr:hypothetical protein [Virgibacillus sp. SK37]AIF45668.1 hypothetical protein X953_18950 [Virgibacillus sp. SK37]
MTNIDVEGYYSHINMFQDTRFYLTFTELYKQIKKGIADPEKVENFIFEVYNNEKLYLLVEQDDLMWKRFQVFEKYMNKYGVYYGVE